MSSYLQIGVTHGGGWRLRVNLQAIVCVFVPLCSACVHSLVCVAAED